MTSIDDLFKRPNLPLSTSSSSNKRKLSSKPHPDEIYKAAKLSSSSSLNGKRTHQPTVSDTVEDDIEDDSAAGPAPPPDDEEAEEEVPDDEEGRFFGEGMSRDTVEVLDYLDEHDKEDAPEEKIDSAWLRRLALNFERKISKNAELRAKFAEEPGKFMASEADLDSDIKALSILSEHPELYGEFAKLGCVGSLVSLLAHENTDVAIDAIEILAEMTDEDVQAGQEQWDTLVEACFEANLPDLLVENLARLDETQEADRNGLYHSLSLLENLCSQPTIAERIIQEDTENTLLKWLLSRIQAKDPPGKTSQNTQYASELLSILLQTSTTSTSNDASTSTSTTSPKSITSTLLTLDTIDVLLRLLSTYRRRSPTSNTEEEEYASNLFDALTLLCTTIPGKSSFLEAEGIELCLLMLREGKFSKPRALSLIDHVLSGAPYPEACVKFVEAAGLKTVFGMFMKEKDAANIEHILGIFNSLLTLLPPESSKRIRTLAKFVEKDYEKVGKLAELRRGYSERLRPVERGIRVEREGMSEEEQEEMEDEWASRRLDAGLYSFQTVSVVLAWLAAEDGGARKKVEKLLTQGSGKGETIEDIKSTLSDQLQGLQGAEHEAGILAADTLRTLLDVL